MNIENTQELLAEIHARLELLAEIDAMNADGKITDDNRADVAEQLDEFMRLHKLVSKNLFAANLKASQMHAKYMPVEKKNKLLARV